MKLNKILLLLALATSSIALGSEQKKKEEVLSNNKQQATDDLLKAAREKDREKMNLLLSQGADPVKALKKAVSLSLVTEVDQLLQVPEIREKANINGYLHHKVAKLDYNMMEVLLHYGADISVVLDKEDKDCDTFVTMANKYHRSMKVPYLLFFLQDKVLLTKDVSQLITKYYSYPLYEKEVFKSIELNIAQDNLLSAQKEIKKDLSWDGAKQVGVEQAIMKDVNRVDSQGYTALIMAIFHNKKDMVSWLLSQGAEMDVPIEDGYLNGQTPVAGGVDAIGLAHKLGRTEIVTMLKTELKDRREGAKKQSCAIEKVSDKEVKAEKETQVEKEDIANKDLNNQLLQKMKLLQKMMNQADAEKDRLMQELDGYLRANHYKKALSFIEDHNLTHVQDSQSWTPLKLALQYNAKDIGKELIRRRAIVTYETCPSPELQAVYTAWQREVQEEDQQKNSTK